jgi:hypothetical protein
MLCLVLSQSSFETLKYGMLDVSSWAINKKLVNRVDGFILLLKMAASSSAVVLPCKSMMTVLPLRLHPLRME